MKTVYMTKTGIVGAEIHIDAAKDSYRWSGKWGAGSGYGVIDFAKRFSETLASKRGAYLESGPGIETYIRKGNPTMKKPVKKTARKTNPSGLTAAERHYREELIAEGKWKNPSDKTVKDAYAAHVRVMHKLAERKKARAKNPTKPKKVYYIVAINKRKQGTQGGDPFGRFTASDIAGYFTGAHFDTERKNAATYRTHAAAHEVAEKINAPSHFKIAVYSPGK